MSQSETAVTYPYQDSSLDIETRVSDLMARMTVEDKAGLMFQPMATFGAYDEPGFLGMPSMRKLLDRRINHYNILGAPTPREIAEWHNALQDEALKTPLGLPVSISTDPRHSFTDNPATALFAGPFSQWPEPMGFAAIGDTALESRFSEIVRREYTAVGIRTALHPQVDLASEPRWSRAMGTFGSDATRSAELAVAQIRALRSGDTLGPDSVSAMVKHFPGGGPQKDGEDPHFSHGREQVYPGDQFELHLEPFRAAIAAGVTQIMPYYGMPVGLVRNGHHVEEVGFGFNKYILTDVLRGELGFDGIICTDWQILGDKAWGVEDLTYEERMVKSLDAGVDQFGGEHRTEVLVGLVRSGKVTESRIDQSVRRLLREKFQLGLFDNRRHVNADAAERIVGDPESVAEGVAAQAAAFTVLRNDVGAARLPLARGVKLYVDGEVPAEVAARTTIVSTPEEADVILARLVAPWEVRGDLERFFHPGSLQFAPETEERIHALAATAPLIVDVYLERPALLERIAADASTLLGNFGAGGEALARVLFGEAIPRGRLPFEIPRSMPAVEASFPDVPNDTVNPVFAAGFGLNIGTV